MSGRGRSIGWPAAWKLALVALALAQPATDVAAQSDLSFSVVNRSTNTISYVYVYADGTPLGRDLLGNDIVPAGGRKRVNPPAHGRSCTYNVRAVYSNEQHEEKVRQDLCSLSELVFYGSSAVSRVPDFDVINRSSLTIVRLYVTNSETWGVDRLPGTLKPGERFKVRLPRDGHCDYNVRVVYSNEEHEERRNQYVCAISEMAFTGPATTAASNPSSNADFDLVNRTSRTILNLYVTTPRSASWGADRLPGILRPGERFKVALPRDGRCTYDVRVVYNNNEAVERLNQNLCSMNELVFR